MKGGLKQELQLVANQVVSANVVRLCKRKCAGEVFTNGVIVLQFSGDKRRETKIKWTEGTGREKR